MTDIELLEQEEAYHQLNAEIELKTRQLMKDVEAVMNKQTNPKLWAQEEVCRGIDDIYYNNDSYTRSRSSYSNFGNKSPISDCCDPVEYPCRPRCFSANSKRCVRKKVSLPTMKTTNFKSSLETDEIIPAAAKGMSAEHLVRFLKAKAKVLQEELGSARREYSIKTDEWRKLQLEMKTYEEEKLKMYADLTTARERVKKQEATIAKITERLTLRDSENNLLKKQLEQLKQDMKKMNLSSTGNEAKLNKAKEEVDKVKTLLKKSQANEKEARDKCRAKAEEMVHTVRKLEKQKAELISGIKKQIYLIDNLKKQKSFLQLDNGTKHLGNEFEKLLDWRPEDEK